MIVMMVVESNLVDEVEILVYDRDSRDFGQSERKLQIVMTRRLYTFHEL